MASGTASTATTRAVGPLDGLRVHTSGPPGPGAGLVAEHLRLLGAGPPSALDPHGAGFHVVVEGAGFDGFAARAVWGESAGDLTDEATVQAATGIMAVHGRRDGGPRGIAADYAATATAVLTVQGVLAGLLAQARGGQVAQVSTSAGRAGLLAVSQYLAAAGAEEGEAAELAPGGPPFTSAEGTVFELETLDPGAWAAFWRALGAPEEAIRAGWRPFQFRYATACAPFAEVLHTTVNACSWERIRDAAEASGAEVCPTDFMVQARTGVGEAVRPADEPPSPSLMTLLDVLGGLLGAEAVLAGLLLRERTGHGVRVDSSLLGAAEALTAPALRRLAAGRSVRRPAGFRRPLPTADGWIAPTDSSAPAAAAYDLRELSTAQALAQLRAHGLTATAVTADLAALHDDPRFAGSINRDAHGAPAVPDPWSFL